MPFDLTKRPTITDWIFEIIQDGADACIFYMKETINNNKGNGNNNSVGMTEKVNTIPISQIPMFQISSIDDTLIYHVNNTNRAINTHDMYPTLDAFFNTFESEYM